MNIVHANFVKLTLSESSANIFAVALISDVAVSEEFEKNMKMSGTTKNQQIMFVTLKSTE